LGGSVKGVLVLARGTLLFVIGAWSLKRCYPASQPSPHFLHNREGLIERFVLIEIIVKSRNERPQSGDRHVWDQLIKHAVLPEQRMGSMFGGIDLDPT
jgi:hypothetical protein